MSAKIEDVIQELTNMKNNGRTHIIAYWWTEDDLEVSTDEYNQVSELVDQNLDSEDITESIKACYDYQKMQLNE